MSHRILLFVFSLFISFAQAEDDTVHILLIGDSTTEAGIPRLTNPDGPHFEEMIQHLLALETGTPATKIYNLGQGGDTAFRLLDSGRYDKEVAPIEHADYIFVRYGINDWSKRAPVEENFPGDFRAVLQRLKKDYPEARIIPMTIIPFMSAEKSAALNKMVFDVSKEEGLEVFDIYPAYAKALEKGPRMLNYRRYPLEKIPEKYHEFIAPRVFGDRLVVMNNEFDALFGDLPGWYGDSHPNLAGYNVIAVETVKYLLPFLQKEKD